MRSSWCNDGMHYARGGVCEELFKNLRSQSAPRKGMGWDGELLPKHAVNTSLYALLRHPWLRKVLGKAPHPLAQSSSQYLELISKAPLRHPALRAGSPGTSCQPHSRSPEYGS